MNFASQPAPSLSLPPGERDENIERVRRCEEGDSEALAELRDQLQGRLLGILQARGATATEAEDTLADVWADCVGQPGERPSLLEKFSGRTTLRHWLATVATNRWLDYKRRQARFVAEPVDRLGPNDPAILPGADPAGAFARETTLVRLLGESLQAAFAQASSQGLVLLRLVYVHGLSQREVGRMLGWSESKLSRFLTAAMKQIEQVTLRELRARDRWLELTWQDFLELCQTQQIGLG